MGLEKFISKTKKTLQGERGRQLLDKAEDAAHRATGGKHDDKIHKARKAADRGLGRNDDEGPHGSQPR